MGHAVKRTAAAGPDRPRCRVGHVMCAAESPAGAGLVFGLVIPNLGETEIFEPICQAIAASPDAAGHALLWAHADTRSPREEQAVALSEQCIARGVSGVFFAPLELSPHSAEINRRVMKMLRDAGIAVVLLDRRPDPETRLRPGGDRQPSCRLHRHQASAQAGRDADRVPGIPGSGVDRAAANRRVSRCDRPDAGSQCVSAAVRGAHDDTDCRDELRCVRVRQRPGGGPADARADRTQVPDSAGQYASWGSTM